LRKAQIKNGPKRQHPINGAYVAGSFVQTINTICIHGQQNGSQSKSFVQIGCNKVIYTLHMCEIIFATLPPPLYKCIYIFSMAYVWYVSHNAMQINPTMRAGKFEFLSLSLGPGGNEAAK